MSRTSTDALGVLSIALFENIIVVLQMARVAARAAQPPPPAYLAERHHQWLVENQYVRVHDVRLQPRETAEFHRHAYDAVAVRWSRRSHS